MQSSTHERRQFFRIHHDILFDFDTVEPLTAEHEEPESTITGLSSVHLLTELRRMDNDLQRINASFTDQQRPLGDYLTTLNSKIDLIARHSLFSAHSDDKITRINISEGGVAFQCKQALNKGKFLVLQIIFLPSYTPVITFAQVSRCEAEGDHHQIAAEFHRLRESDRQELARQILKAQISQRKRATNPESKI